MSKEQMREAFKRDMRRDFIDDVDRQTYTDKACAAAWNAALASTEAPRVDEREALADKFQQALALLWFWLPEQEPDPHSKSKAITERNKRWHAACKLYQEECKK